MKILYGVATALLIAGLIAAWGEMWRQLAYAPGLTPVVLYLEAELIIKSAMSLCVLITIFGGMGVPIGPIVALFRQPSAARIVALCLALLGAIAVLLGALAWLYGEIAIRQATAETGISRADILAPGRAEGLLALSMGLFPGALLIGSAFLTQWLADLLPARRKPA